MAPVCVPPVAPDEDLRLATLATYAPAADLGDAALDELVRLAAKLCGTPIALVTLLGAEHQDFAARVGVDVAGTSRDVAFCAHAVAAPDEPLIVEDARLDARFATNPFVADDPGIRFYAGFPLLADDQQPLGTLCVLDHAPRLLDAIQLEQLAALSRAAMAHLTARRAILAVHASHRKLASVLRSAPDAFVAMDEHGVVRGWNPAAETLFGWTEEEAIGRRVGELIVPDELRQAHETGLQRFMQGRTSAVLDRALELPAVRRDGSMIEIEMTIGCVEGDGVATFTAFIRDIGRRKDTERALERERLFTGAVLDSMDTAVVACDAEGRLSLFNRAARDLHGVDTELLEPDDWADRYGLFAADGATPLDERTVPLARAYRGETVRNDLIVVRRHDAGPRTMSVSGREVVGADGRGLGAVVAMHDLTDRLSEERARREADLMFRAAFDAAPIGMVLVGVDGRFARVNDAIVSITGYSAAELLALEPISLIHPDDVEEVRRRFGVVGASADSVRMTHRIRTATGETARVVVQTTLLRDDDGAPRHVLAQINDVTEQHLAQEQLAEQHAFVTAVVDTAASLVLVLDRDGAITTFNAACERLSGRRSEEVLGLRVWDVLLPEEDVPRVQAAFHDIIGGDFPHHSNNQWQTVDGERRLIEWVTTALCDEDGQVTHVVGTGIEITERHAAERALRASEHDLRTITAAVPSGILRIDLAGRWTYVNARSREIWGLDPDAAFDDFDWIARLHPDDRERVVTGWDMAKEGSGSYEARFRVLRGDGSARWYFTRARAELDEGGRRIGYISTTIDVHDHHVAQEALREAENRFRGTFEQAPIGVAIIDLDGRMREVNDALCTITGYRREELERMFASDLSHPSSPHGSHDALDALLSAQMTTARTEELCRRADGHPLWLNRSTTVLCDSTGVPTHLLSHFVDVTERKVFEEQLRHMADHDPLTGLVNRRRFGTLLDEHLAGIRRYGAEGALLIVDVDRFKLVNDTFGHTTGDRTILRVASLLRSHLRETDVVARLGGDEFAVLLRRARRDEATGVAAKLVALVADAPGPGPRVTISVGLRVFGEDREITAEQALAEADRALYAAKQRGRDRWSDFDVAPGPDLDPDPG